MLSELLKILFIYDNLNIVTKSYIIEKQKSEKSALSSHLNFEVNFCSYLEPGIILH